jgi:hypothetical protein
MRNEGAGELHQTVRMDSTRLVRAFMLGAVAIALGLVASHQRLGRLSAADTIPSAQLKLGGANIDVSFASGNLDLPPSATLRWVTRAAEAVTAYYGHFPVPNMQIRVQPSKGESGIFGGTTWGYRGGYTRISVGEHTSQRQLDSDWMLTHEMTHMAFPDVPDRHHWIEEGIATYVEPIARAQAGQLSVDKIWRDMVRDMPQGEPGPRDRGLDNTPSWGRTYWGGAMFCLVADVRIREATHNRKGLQDALRGIVAAGGTIQYEWPIAETFRLGDKATGTTVLSDLYAQMKDAPVNVDLDELWRRLGIVSGNGGMSFDDRAPLAEVRKAITAPPDQAVAFTR